jgi:hypothetical protein
MLAFVKKVNIRTWRYTKCFRHWGQFSGSLTLADGWGTSTIFVPCKWRWWILSGPAADQLMYKAVGSDR